MRDKEKYKKLAALSKEKQVPEGYVYIGKGKSGGLPFSNMAGRVGGNWIYNVEGNCENWDYACPEGVWGEVTGEKLAGFTCKTAAEWFKELPSPYREMASYYEGNNNCEYDSLIDALECGFAWDKTPQGDDFWGAVFDAVEDKTPLPPVPVESKRKELIGFCEYPIVLDEAKGLICGCQEISKEKTLELAAEIQSFYKGAPIL